MEPFDLIVNGTHYHITPREEGGIVSYSTVINGTEVVFRPENGHLKAVADDLPEDLMTGIAHAIESNFL